MIKNKIQKLRRSRAFSFPLGGGIQGRWKKEAGEYTKREVEADWNRIFRVLTLILNKCNIYL